MPLPMALDHINLYLLDDGDGWFLIDTGMNLPDTKEIWEIIFAEHMIDKPVKGLIVTHMHPDHIGLAGWICERWRVPLYMSAGEYFAARTYTSVAPDQSGLSRTTAQFYRRAGQTEAYLAFLAERMGSFSKMVSPMPTGFRRLISGANLSIGDRQWRVVSGGGHSIEHVCLYCEEDELLLAGDQIIAKITSNVSVMATEPEANPLQEWYDSQFALKLLSSVSLVLPAHNRPFIGLHARVDELIEHHEEHLLALLDACKIAKTAVDLLPVLFKREIQFIEMSMALGECIAHLHMLMKRGLMNRSLKDGVYLYQS
jgi:glyoxylase-like metal-dependent hydrolase (beta-lactamase superfamily II)